MQRAGSRSIGPLGAPPPAAPALPAKPARRRVRRHGHRALAVRLAAREVQAERPESAADPGGRASRAVPSAPAPRLRRAALGLLLAVGGIVVTLLLWPTGGHVRVVHIFVWNQLSQLMGAPTWFTPEVAEQLANALILIVPAAAVTVLAWRVPWWLLALIGGTIGIAVELAQYAFLPNRVTDPVDAVWNAVGAWAGIAIGFYLRERSRGVKP